MYSVWFSDCVKAIEKIKAKLPKMETFCSIEGNAYGDFIIKDGVATYLVKHDNFSVWVLVGDWKKGQWVEVE